MRARLLEGASDLALDTGEDVAAMLRARQGLELNRELGNEYGVAHCLFIVGLAYTIDGEWSAAHDCLVECIRLFRALGDDRYALMASRRLAWTYEHLQGLEQARALHEENLRVARATGDESIQAESLAVLGQYALEDGRVAEALPMLKEAYDLHRERPDLPDRYQLVLLLCRFARALALERRPTEAARLIACAELLFEELGVVVESWITELNDKTLELIRPEVDDAALDEAREEGRLLTVDDAVALALDALE